MDSNQQFVNKELSLSARRGDSRPRRPSKPPLFICLCTEQILFRTKRMDGRMNLYHEIPGHVPPGAVLRLWPALDQTVRPNPLTPLTRSLTRSLSYSHSLTLSHFPTLSLSHSLTLSGQLSIDQNSIITRISYANTCDY
jgi:hypothetical protein